MEPKEYTVEQESGPPLRFQLDPEIDIESNFLTMPFLAEAWVSLSHEEKLRLEKLLPHLDGENNLAFKQETLKRLFRGDNFRFGNPISTFKAKLTTGHFSETHLKKKEILRRRERKMRKLSMASKSLLNLKETRYDQEGIGDDVRKLAKTVVKKMKKESIEERIAKRQITELRRIRQEVREKGDSSDDEQFISDMIQNRFVRTSQIKSIQSLQSAPAPPPKQVQKPPPPPAANPDPDAQTSKPVKGGSSKTPKQSKPRVNKHAQVKDSSKAKEETQKTSKRPAVEAINKVAAKKVQQYQDLDELTHEAIASIEPPPLEKIPRPPIANPPPAPTMMESRTSSFFKLLRSFFFDMPHRQITIPDLMTKLSSWEVSAAEQRPSWFNKRETTWSNEIPSAVAFLSGAFPDALPADFNAFITCDTKTGLYQWRLDDNEKSSYDQLTDWWYDRRSICQAITTGGEQQQQQQSQEQKPKPSKSPKPKPEATVPSPIVTKEIESRTLQGSLQQLLKPSVRESVSFVTIVQEALAKLPGGKGTLDQMADLVTNTGLLEPNIGKSVVSRAITTVLSLLKKAASASQQQQQQRQRIQQQQVAQQQQQQQQQVLQLKTSQGTKMYRVVSGGAAGGATISPGPGGAALIHQQGQQQPGQAPVQQVQHRQEVRVIRGAPGAYIAASPGRAQVSGTTEIIMDFLDQN